MGRMKYAAQRPAAVRDFDNRASGGRPPSAFPGRIPSVEVTLKEECDE